MNACVSREVVQSRRATPSQLLLARLLGLLVLANDDAVVSLVRLCELESVGCREPVDIGAGDVTYQESAALVA